MGEFICQNCGKTVENKKKVVCPYCSGRILIKRASKQVKELPAE
jgi:DNA-directed RNA polymerase subunit RPC12/RpoP